MNQKQLNEFIGHISIRDYSRSDKKIDGLNTSTISFETRVIPPHETYLDLYRISQTQKFSNLKFDATYVDECDSMTNLYRWVPHRGSHILVTDKDRLLISEDGNWPLPLNEPYFDEPTLDHLLDSTAGLFWARNGQTIEDHIMLEALKKRTQKQLSGYTWEEFRSESRMLLARCEQLSAIVPDGWEKVSHCRSCGFIWSKVGEHLQNCEWCWVTKKGTSFPQPQTMDDDFAQRENKDIPF